METTIHYRGYLGVIYCWFNKEPVMQGSSSCSSRRFVPVVEAAVAAQRMYECPMEISMALVVLAAHL